MYVNGLKPLCLSPRYNLLHICIHLHVHTRELPASPSHFIFLFGHCSAPLEQLGWPLVQGHPSSIPEPSVFLICFPNPDLPVQPQCPVELLLIVCYDATVLEKINLMSLDVSCWMWMRAAHFAAIYHNSSQASPP